MSTYPELSKFESLLFSYLVGSSQLLKLATVSENHPLKSGDLGSKGRVTVGEVNSLPVSSLTRLQLNAAYRFTCWDFSYAKSRRLQETVIGLIESWDKPQIEYLKILTPVFETPTSPTFSASSQLYFSSVTYRFPVTRVSLV